MNKSTQAKIDTLRMKNLIKKYNSLELSDVIDYNKFNLITISHHSTKIEGSTLTMIESQVLINDGLTPKGKPMDDSLMVRDHYNALVYIIELAITNQSISVELIQKINSEILKNTGKIYNSMMGSVDSSKGEFRKGNVVIGETYFPNYDKVEKLTNELVLKLNDRIKNVSENDLIEQLYISFDAHFGLVSIHPFYDGNGRTSRLLMNYIQSLFGLPLGIVFSEDKTDYIEALVETRKEDDISIFRNFMSDQYKKHLETEISKYQNSIKKGKGFNFLF